jgi:hypothetical protein
MSNEPFFKRQDGRFLPQPVSAGPWDPKSLHGRVIIGLLAHEIEVKYGGDPDMVPARLTVDMYKLPDFSEVEVTTRVVRDGYRIKVIDAEFISGGVSAGRATCQLLRRSQAPEGTVWSPPNWDAPHPETLPVPEPRAGMGGMWAMRPISGGMGQSGPRRTWMAEVRDVVGGSPITPWQRAALAADFASPFANGAQGAGLGYINSDATLYLHRAMVGEWIGFEVVNHGATDGVAIGECWLYDVEGPIGTATVCALAQKRPMR